MIVAVKLQGPFRLADPASNPRLERSAALDVHSGIYLETIEMRAGEYPTCYAGASYGNSLCDRINTRIDFDRHNDCRCAGDAFLRGKRVPLPGKRRLDLNEPEEREQIERIYKTLRYFVAPLDIDGDKIASWLGTKQVKNRHSHLVKCVENEIIRTIKSSCEACSDFLYNKPRSFKPIPLRLIFRGFSIMGLADSSRRVFVERPNADDLAPLSLPSPTLLPLGSHSR